MLGLLDSFAARLPRKPAAYLYLFFVWAVTLWFLSAGNPVPKGEPDIPHLDKVVHFLYFFAGGALLVTHAGLKWSRCGAGRLFLVVALICCILGRLDEYHQGFTPGRSGNDTGDWIADTLGGAAGAWFMLVWLLPGMRRKLVVVGEAEMADGTGNP